MKPVDLHSPIPYYIQVKESIRRAVQDTFWKPGEQIPGEPELCVQFGVSRTVIRQALSELEYEGLIYRRKGKGTFIAEPKITENLIQRLTGFYQDMAERGHPPISRILKQQVLPPDPGIASTLNLTPGSLVVEIERLRFVDSLPLVLVTTYLPHILCQGLENVDLSHQSLYDLLERQFGLSITRGQRTLEAVAAGEYEARLLEVEVGAPLMLLNSISFISDGSPVEYYRAYHRGDRSRFEVELLRRREPVFVTETNRSE